LHYFCAVSPGYNDFLDFIVNRERPLWNAILNGRFWPGAPIEHSAAKQTYINPPILPSSAFSEYGEPPLPARFGHSGY
jgi:hypothetical protein